MYIIAIGWMYVVTLMAATETNFIAGLVTFLFYGLFPCSVLMYLMGTKRRRAKIKAKEEAELALQNAQQAGQAASESPDAKNNEDR